MCILTRWWTPQFCFYLFMFKCLFKMTMPHSWTSICKKTICILLCLSVNAFTFITPKEDVKCFWWKRGLEFVYKRFNFYITTLVNALTPSYLRKFAKQINRHHIFVWQIQIIRRGVSIKPLLHLPILPQTTKKCYPPAKEASREVPNLNERKKSAHPYTVAI